MNKISVLATLLCLFAFSQSFALTLSEAQNTLAKYTNSDFETSPAKSEKEVAGKVQETLKIIEQTVDLLMKDAKAPSEGLIKELIRTSELTYHADPSVAAAELLLPLYQKEKKTFEKVFKSFPKKIRDDVKESLQNAAREEAEGNG